MLRNSLSQKVEVSTTQPPMKEEDSLVFNLVFTDHGHPEWPWKEEGSLFFNLRSGGQCLSQITLKSGPLWEEERTEKGTAQRVSRSSTRVTWVRSTCGHKN